MALVNSTHQFYSHVGAIAHHLNRALFANSLPIPLFTLKRGIGSLGYFAPSRWFAEDGQAVGEIALNPALFAQHSWLHLMQTIAQQQCHLWQHTFGQPSRAGYHNAQWARKMQEIGLMPSSTGKPGGRMTGQSMSAYPVPGGKFITACAELADGPLSTPLSARWREAGPPLEAPLDLRLPRRTLGRLTSSIGVWSDDQDFIDREATKDLKRKLKYTCPRCDVNVWGRPGLRLLCNSCKLAMREVPAAVRVVHARP